MFDCQDVLNLVVQVPQLSSKFSFISLLGMRMCYKVENLYFPALEMSTD